MFKKVLKNNPYIFSYLSFALLCCIGLSILFLYINIENIKKTELESNQKKLELITNDLDTQLKTLKKINLKLQTNSAYKPSNYETNKYNEKVLLEDFTQYRYYSPLECEYLLYYKGMNTLFSSNGTTITLHVWLNNWNTEEQQKIVDFLNNPVEISILTLPSTDSFLIRYPLSGMSKPGIYDSALYVLIENKALLERFQIVSGGLSGEFALLKGDQVIISTTTDFTYTTSHILFKTTNDGCFTLYFIPNNQNGARYAVMPLQLSLIFVAFILILFIATLFANHSYKPILQMSEKYKNILPVNKEALFSNELDTLNYMMDSMIKHNVTANRMLEQKQMQLRNQLLLLIINGNVTFEIQPYFLQLGMKFPGPWYFVISLRLQEKIAEDNSILEEIKKIIESSCNPNEDKYIYCVMEPEEQLLNCLCSISEIIQKEEIIDEILAITENFETEVHIGTGNAYTNIHNLSASYLDARDKIHEAKKKTFLSADGTDLQDYSLLSQICISLINDNLELALLTLEQYIQHIKNEAPSVLIQQYLFSNFLNEMNHLYKENRLEIPKQYLSLLLSAKGIEQFSQAAREIVQNFSTQLSVQKRKCLENVSEQVLQYINKHFTDYDISIEKVAQYTDTNATFIRMIIKETYGMTYIDYLIYLRIEYAKMLLISENLTVAETCQKIGYSKVSYFIKLFKAHTGVTPATFKKNGVINCDMQSFNSQ